MELRIFRINYDLNVLKIIDKLVDSSITMEDYDFFSTS